MNLEERAKAQGEKASKLDAATQFAMVTAMPNIINGAFWGFCQPAEAMKYKDSLKANKNIHVKKINGGCLVEVQPDFLLGNMNAVDPTLVNQKDIANIKNGIAQAVSEMDKFLERKKKDAKFRASLVGIYCVNDSTAISYKGVRYPAFRVELSTALKLLAKHGYKIKVNGSYVPVASVMGDVKQLCSNMMLSPTNTGVFIDISK